MKKYSGHCVVPIYEGSLKLKSWSCSIQSTVLSSRFVNQVINLEGQPAELYLPCIIDINSCYQLIRTTYSSVMLIMYGMLLCLIHLHASGAFGKSAILYRGTSIVCECDHFEITVLLKGALLEKTLLKKILKTLKRTLDGNLLKMCVWEASWEWRNKEPSIIS